MILLLLMLVEHGVPLDGPWYLVGSDSIGYTDPIDALLRGQGYSPDYRMPGYGAPYLILRLFLDQHTALGTLVVLHVLASALAVVFIARLSFLLSDDPRVFRAVFWLALIATYASSYDRQILTESFSVLALCLAAHQTVTHLRTARTLPLLTAGCATTWLIFMKPVYLPMLGLLALAVLRRRNGEMRKKLAACAVLCAPFVVADGAWVCRNALVHGRFQPLTATVISPELRSSIKFPLIRLMQAFGANFVWWDPGAEIRWFNIRYGPEGAPQFADRQPPLPDYVYTDRCTRDSLVTIAGLVERYNNSTSIHDRQALLTDATDRCERCIVAFREEHPFHYHITARLRMMRIFLLHSGTTALMGRPFAELDVVRRSVRVFYSFLYLVPFVAGAGWAVRCLVSKRAAVGSGCVAALLLYGLTVFPFAMRMTEFRYSTTFYLLALMLAVFPAMSGRHRLFPSGRRTVSAGANTV